MRETTRVQLELPKQSMDRLVALKKKTEAASYAEVIRQALKAYEEMIAASEAGVKA